ncbi:glycine cleavage system protein R [Nitrospina sp. 32_T5]|uniref:glycine cleavage system protein R n=1 Tax=unclassified Nitrospina TaxID=2638683 RepID=UPI003F9BF841
MENWFMLSMVGKDRPGIVARLSASLCRAGCNLGESSMAALSDNFTIMMMVHWEGTQDELIGVVQPIGDNLGLTFNIHPVPGKLEHHRQPDIRVSIYAEDRKGIVEDVTTALADAGLNILHLDSNFDEEPGSPKPTFYLHIEGTLSKGIEPVEKALDTLCEEKRMNIQLIPVSPGIK